MQPARKISYHQSQGFISGCFQAMASPCEIILETDDLALAKQVTEAVAHETWRVETTFSRYCKDNTIYKINHSKGKTVKVDAETAHLLDYADTCYELSDGLFDITSGILGRVWKFDGSNNIPSLNSINNLLPLIGWDKVKWEKPYLTLKQGMSLDLGGIGKEYAVDLVAAITKSQISLPFLINFGGDIYANKPPKSKNGWIIGIEPIQPGKRPPKIVIRSGGAATSGDSKRFLKDGRNILSHVLNPKAGWPVENAPASVTVLNQTCTQSGTLATLAMLQGENAENFLKQQKVKFWVQRRDQ